MNAKLYQSVLRIINSSSYFKQGDFIISDTDEHEYDVIFKITYRFLPRFFFLAKRKDFQPEQNPKLGDISVIVTQTPGELDDAAEFVVKGIDDLFDSITRWEYGLRDELQAIQAMKAYQKEEIEIEEFFSKLDEFPNEHFSTVEVKEIELKLEKRIQLIEKDLAQIKEKADEDSKESQLELIQLREDIKNLKNQLAFLNKKNWAGSFLARYKTWSTNSIKMLGLQSGSQSIKVFLTEGLNQEDSLEGNSVSEQ